MERPCQVSVSGESARSSSLFFASLTVSRPPSRPPTKGGARAGGRDARHVASVAVERASATVDHSDIRGSEPHNRDPSGATSD